VSRPIIGRAVRGLAIGGFPITVSNFGAGFCGLKNLSSLFPPQNATVIITNPTVSYSADGPGQSNAVLSHDPYNLEGDVWQEVKVTAATPNTVVGLGANPPFGPGPINGDGIGVLINPGGTSTAFLFSDFGGIPLWSNTSITSLPYVIQLRINSVTGEMTYEDNASIPNTGSLGLYPQNIGNPINIAVVGAGLAGGETADFEMNLGYEDPVITPPAGYKGYCKTESSGRALLCGTLIGFEPLFGNTNPNLNVTQGFGEQDDTYNIVNTAIDQQSLTYATNTTWNVPGQPALFELGFLGANVASDDNAVGFTWASFLGLIGAGIIVFPKTQSGTDGSLAFANQYTQIIQGYAEQIIINKGGVAPFDPLTVTWVSGGGGDLRSIGFELSTENGGQLQSLSRIPLFDFSVDPLVFNFQYGANPPVPVTINSINPSAEDLALDIQSQIQGAGGVYADVTAFHANGIDIQSGYTLSIGIDLALEEMDLYDNLGNTININLNGFIDVGTLAIVKLTAPDYFATASMAGGAIMDVRFNAGKYVPQTALPAKYKGHCDVGPGQKLYAWGTTFSVDGNVTQENGVFPLFRTQVLTNDIAETENPAAVAVFSDQIFSATSFTTNCFEAEITFLDPDVLREQWQVGLNAVVNTDLRLTRSGTGETLILQSEYPSNNPITLANDLPAFAVGDVMTVCVFDNGGFPVTPSLQFVIKVGSTLVIYDKLKMAQPQVAGELPYTAFSELNNPFSGNPGNLPDGNQAKITFNGIDGDYAVTDYPPDFLNYNGDPMPLSINGAFQRSAEFVPFAFTTNQDRSITFSNLNKTLQIVNGITGTNDMIGHLPLFMDFVIGESVLVGFRVDTANGEFELVVEGIQYEQCRVVVEQFGADVYARFYNDNGTSSSSLIRAGYTIQNGDLIYLQFYDRQIIEPVVIGKCDVFLWDSAGAQLSQSIGNTYTDTTIDGDPDQRNWSFAFLAGCRNVPVSGTAQITSQCKSADMDSNITSLPAIVPGCVDLEGTLV
jgi:hypothetical protein